MLHWLVVGVVGGCGAVCWLFLVAVGDDAVGGGGGVGIAGFGVHIVVDAGGSFV